jgi:hypothetical protein
VPFTLWPFQQDAVATLNQYDRLFALKARQLGITWLILAHLLYLGAFWGNRLFLIASQSGSDAIDALHRLRVMYNSLDEQPVAMVKDNTEEIAFANGSRFESMKATKRAGRSKAAFAGFADEIAFWDWPEEQLNALDSACQSLYAVTTGNGPGDLAHTIWEQAERGEGRWKTLFIPWHAHPGRDADWHRLNVDEAPEPRLARREHAATPEDAFAAPGGIFFERFNSDVNVDDVDVEPSWPTYRGVDFGWHHAACLWAQVSPTGQPFIVDELLPEHLTTDQFAAAILAREKGWNLWRPPVATYCDPAGKQMNVQTAQTEFEVFRRVGLNPRGKAVGRRDGAVLIMNHLAEPQIPLVVARRCHGLRDALAQSKPNKARPDCYDFEHPIFAHPLDTLKYLLANLPRSGGSGSAIATGRPGKRRRTVY